MKLAVIGAGGVGGFLGSLLCRAGHDVTFLARGAHLAAIRKRGLEISSAQFGNFRVHPAATDNVAELGCNNLVLVAVKMYDFEDVREVTKTALEPTGVAVPIQNGLDAADLLAAVVGRERTLIGSASIEALITAPGTIGHMVPTHWITLAELSGPPGERLWDLEATLNKAEITVKLAADGRQALWDKAALLIPFATLTSAADCGLGEMWSTLSLRKVWVELRDEAVAVAAADGYDVRESIAIYEGTFEKILPAASAFTSSMNRDFRSEKRSELEWLTGKLIRLADEKDVRVPAHDALYGVLKMKAQRQAQKRRGI